jgi:hypothetical protein
MFSSEIKFLLVLFLVLSIPALAYGEWLSIGKSNSKRWTEVVAHDGKLTTRQLSVTSTDGQSELIVQFFPELGGLGMSVLFFDRPAASCHTDEGREILKTTEFAELLLNANRLPGKHVGSFATGCAEEKWIERTLLGNANGNVAIVQALLNTKQGVVHISTADGKFDHSYNVRDFRSLERGSLEEYLHSKSYQMSKSMEHQ